MRDKQNHIASKLQKSFGLSEDFTLETKEMNGEMITFCYLKSLVDVSKTALSLENIQDKDWSKLAMQLGAETNRSESELAKDILTGKLIILHAAGNLSWRPFSPSIQRSITTPQSESNIQNAMDAFTENLESNLALLRTHLRSKDLGITLLEMGNIRKRKLSVCYIQGKADEKLVHRILSHLISKQESELETIQDFNRLIKQRGRWSPVPLFQLQEQPEQAVSLLMNGRVVIMLDQMPYALLIPPLITDLFLINSDRNLPPILMVAVRSIRVIGLLITLVIPGLYVALVSVNPEVFRIDMALSVAKSREGVPYPALIEILITLLIVEMIVGASIRLPKSVGPTITMVGGIILGQALVQAQLVSNLLIIVLAATTIANFTLAGFQNALMIRLFKYGNVILGSIFGILGIMVGFVWFIFYLSGINTYRIPYLGRKVAMEEANE
ncbi:spore germination protein [Paenibacillus tarimensis]